jgi:hypothetical protein
MKYEDRPQDVRDRVEKQAYKGVSDPAPAIAAAARSWAELTVQSKSVDGLPSGPSTSNDWRTTETASRATSGGDVASAYVSRDSCVL